MRYALINLRKKMTNPQIYDKNLYSEWTASVCVQRVEWQS
jgi:hypothetical protein